MSRLAKHMVVLLLLLFFAGEAVGTVATGLSHCNGRCGCCDKSLHGASVTPKTAAPLHQMMMAIPRKGPSQGGCCMPMSSILPDCGRDQARNLALISKPPLTGQQARLRLSTTAVSAASFVAPECASRDPYAAILLACATAIPIFLLTAVFLC